MEKGGFDAVIGNPPYDVFGKRSGTSDKTGLGLRF